MKESSPIVYVVDDEPSVCLSLRRLLRSVGLEARTFGSALEFLHSKCPDVPGCLVLDVRLPGLSGPDLQAELAARKITLPIIFVTGHGDIPMSVRAMKAGAVDFLTKPFREQDILDAVTAALEKDSRRRLETASSDAVAALAETLTPREREVMASVVKGLMNKQIAFDLGISEITVKLHRGNVMRKMEVRSVADLVRKTELLK